MKPIKIQSLGAWDIKGMGRVHLVKSEGIYLGCLVELRGVVRRVKGLDLRKNSQYVGIILE